MTKIVKRYISQEQINRYCLNIVSMMWADDFKPDIVVGITRGGLLPAIMISHYLGIKMHTIDVRLRDAKIKENAKYLKSEMIKGKKILIIDDINDTGETFNFINKNFGGEDRVRTAAIIHNAPSKFTKLNYYCYGIDKDILPCWNVFPWEEW